MNNFMETLDFANLIGEYARVKEINDRANLQPGSGSIFNTLMYTLLLLLIGVISVPFTAMPTTTMVVGEFDKGLRC